jgi:hypothetical protein
MGICGMIWGICEGIIIRLGRSSMVYSTYMAVDEEGDFSHI